MSHLELPQHSLSCVCNKHVTNSIVLLNALTCVNEKHGRNREKWPARPYSSSGAGSGVVLRHRAAAAGCMCLPHCGCGYGSGILHAEGRSPD